MNQNKQVIVNYCDRNRAVEVTDGPRRLFANSTKNYYEGFVLPEPLDPYGEPYKIFFTEEAIVKMNRTLWETTNTSWSELTRDEQDELIGACLRSESVKLLGRDVADDGPEVDVIRAIHWNFDLDSSPAPNSCPKIVSP